MSFEQPSLNKNEEGKNEKEGGENKELIPQTIDDKIEGEEALLEGNLEELKKEINEFGGEEKLEQTIKEKGEEKIKEILSGIKDSATELKETAFYLAKVYGPAVLTSSFTLGMAYAATLDIPNSHAEIGAGVVSGLSIFFSGFAISSIKDIKECIKHEKKKGERERKKLWENPNNPEGENQAIIKFNKKGLIAEFKDGTKVTGKMPSDLRKFHKEGYTSHGTGDHGFSGYSLESADENTQVIKLHYPHAVPSGGDFASYSSCIIATIDKKNKTATFENVDGVLTS